MKDSVSPTVATASAPRCATTNTSTTTKTLSMSISSTMGTARMKMARPIGPLVKSRPCAPASASRMAAQTDGISSGGARLSAELLMWFLAEKVVAKKGSPRLRGCAGGAMIAPGVDGDCSLHRLDACARGCYDDGHGGPTRVGREGGRGGRDGEAHRSTPRRCCAA